MENPKHRTETYQNFHPANRKDQQSALNMPPPNLFVYCSILQEFGVVPSPYFRIAFFKGKNFRVTR